MEALHLREGDVFEINIGGVAEYLSKEVPLFFICEQELFFFLVFSLSVLIDPFEKLILVTIKVGLLDKHFPQCINILGPHTNFLWGSL